MGAWRALGAIPFIVATSFGAQAVPSDTTKVAPALPEAPATPTCLTRRSTQTDAPNFDFTIVAPQAKTADFTAKGFVSGPCPTRLNSTAKLPAYKAMVCDLAQGNDAVQARTAQVLGIDARKMCAAIKTILPDAATDPSAQPTEIKPSG